MLVRHVDSHSASVLRVTTTKVVLLPPKIYSVLRGLATASKVRTTTWNLFKCVLTIYDVTVSLLSKVIAPENADSRVAVRVRANELIRHPLKPKSCGICL